MWHIYIYKHSKDDIDNHKDDDDDDDEERENEDDNEDKMTVMMMMMTMTVDGLHIKLIYFLTLLMATVLLHTSTPPVNSALIPFLASTCLKSRNLGGLTYTCRWGVTYNPIKRKQKSYINQSKFKYCDQLKLHCTIK